MQIDPWDVNENIPFLSTEFVRLYLSAFFGCFSNGFSRGKKYVCEILKFLRHIFDYVPCIFSFLPRGYNTLKISFHFFCAETAVFRHKFLVVLCPLLRFLAVKNTYGPNIPDVQHGLPKV